uniref:Pr1-like protein n=1 Tax=Oryza sativa subsp. japonica TaxID=39947 RepID=Q5Z4J0_ORYSJ|nr:pr1-like protein [Oryza sativa Japonica Group]BAD62342.1 pr1-like protein [Oryza sativa Japonica Group]
MAEREGARTGSTGVGPTRQPLGPRWTGGTRLAAAGAPRGAPEGGLAGTADGRRRTHAPMVAAGDQRRSGVAPEREEGRGKRTERSTAHPGTTTTAETTTGAEESGGAVRDGEGDGAPAVGERSGGADEVDDDAAKPMEVTPRREEVRSDDGGEAELGGDGGEKMRRREHDSDGESERRTAETEERGTGNVYIAPGERESGRRERNRPRRSRLHQ